MRRLPKNFRSEASKEVEGLHRVVLGCCTPTQTCQNARACSSSREGCEWLTRGWVTQGMCGLVGSASRGRAGRGSGMHLVGEGQLSTLFLQRGSADSKNGRNSTPTTWSNARLDSTVEPAATIQGVCGEPTGGKAMMLRQGCKCILPSSTNKLLGPLQLTWRVLS